MAQPLESYVGRFVPFDGALVAGEKAAPSGCVGPSEGARMLAARPEEKKSLAKLVEVSPQLLTMWCSGARYPSDEARAAMPSLFGIPAEAWKVWRPAGPKAKAPPPSAPGATPPAGASIVDQMRHASSAVQSATTPEDLKLATGKLEAIAKVARVESLASKGRLHDHPDWGAFLDAVVTALAPIPGALEAFEAGAARAAESGGAT